MNIPRLIRTVAYLKPRQVISRLLLPFHKTSLDVRGPANAREIIEPPVAFIDKPASMAGPRRFRLLSKDLSIESPESWNDDQVDKLLLYNIHYMDDLVALDASRRKEWHDDLILAWVNENPPAEGNGWEPYPLSLRIVNWVKWAIANPGVSDWFLESLYLQAHVLRQRLEFHQMANHLLANAKALYVAGAFFDGADADEWLEKGRAILESEIHEQIKNDGGHFELSPMYHSIILEDILDVLNFSDAFGVQRPKSSQEAVLPMLHWLRIMCHGDGEVSYFNDSTGGVAPSLDNLLQYAVRLGFTLDGHLGDGISSLPDTGYVRYQSGDLAVLMDVGEVGPRYQPGHGHCDCLSFELSVGEQRFIVNSGISTYNVSERRHLERSTESHNTVSVPGHEQSEIWSAFRVGRRAYPRDIHIRDGLVEAAHDGYSRLGITHRRRFRFSGQKMKVEDSLEAGSSIVGQANFHFAPGVDVSESGGVYSIGNVSIQFGAPSKVELAEYDFCVGFNEWVTAKMLCVTFDSQLVTTICNANPLH